MADKNFEWLTLEICNEYRRRAMQLPQDDGQDTGARRELRLELQNRCNILEIEAINILNGYHIQAYVQKYEIMSGAIPEPEGLRRRRSKEKQKDEKQARPTPELMEEYEKRIAYLEQMTGLGDDGFSFEEKSDD
jgi:hypothetical protein